MLLLFESSTMEGWPDVMYDAIDATTPGHVPERNASKAQGLYVIAWVLVGGMFLLNVFVGVIVDKFAHIKRVEARARLLFLDHLYHHALSSALLLIPSGFFCGSF